MPIEYVWNDTLNQLANPLAWTPNGVFANDDTARIPASARLQPTASLDISAAQLAKFTIEPGCPIGIGGDGSPAIIDADQIHLAGYGTAYIEPVHSGDSEILVDSPNTDMALKVASGTAGPRLMIQRGHVLWVNPDGDILELDMTFGNDAARDASIEIEDTATLTAYVNMMGGRVTNHKPVGYCNWGGGTWIQAAASMTSAVLAGATVYWDGGGSFGGQAILIRGTLDTTRVRRTRSMGRIIQGPEAVYKYIPELNASLPIDLVTKFGGVRR